MHPIVYCAWFTVLVKIAMSIDKYIENISYLCYTLFLRLFSTIYTLYKKQNLHLHFIETKAGVVMCYVCNYICVCVF